MNTETRQVLCRKEHLKLRNKNMRICSDGCKSPRNTNTNRFDVDAIKNSPIEIDGYLPEEEVYIEEFNANRNLCHQCDASC